MAEADRLAAEGGVSVEALMGAAGLAVAAAVKELFAGATTALVLCGQGNNGGDGYVAARELAGGLEVTVLEAAAEPRTAAARAARAALTARSVEPQPLSAKAVAAWLAAADPASAVVIDALLGCGLSRPLLGWLAEVVAALNAGAVPVVAVDVPTGVEADKAVPPGAYVRADVTVQLAGPKVASAFYPARAAFSGARPGAPAAVLTADIGMPAHALEAVGGTLVLDSDAAAAWLPRRAPDAHKYSAGTVTVVAGSRRYLGAAELVCRGAWRAGAGLVTLVCRERHPASWPETVLALPHEKGAWPPPELTGKAAGALVVGPGLEPEAPGAPFRDLTAVVRWAPGHLVLDAAALRPDQVGKALKALRARGEPAVLTPHAGEAARLIDALGLEADVTDDPLGAARALAAATSAVTVLKGPATVVASPDGREAVSPHGHPGMAVGGAGDVLAGALGAVLAAPGGDVFERTCAAVTLHGLAGERAARDRGVGLVASDVADALSSVLADLQP